MESTDSALTRVDLHETNNASALDKCKIEAYFFGRGGCRLGLETNGSLADATFEAGAALR